MSESGEREVTLQRLLKKVKTYELQVHVRIGVAPSVACLTGNRVRIPNSPAAVCPERVGQKAIDS